MDICSVKSGFSNVVTMLCGRDVSVVGITSLGIDHTALLGNTLSSIAWQKAGILKPSAEGYTVPGHTPEALKVIGERSVERKVSIQHSVCT